MYLPSLPASYFSIDDESLIEIPQLKVPVTLQTISTLFTVGTHIDYYPIRDFSYLVDRILWPTSTTAARLHQLLLFQISSLLIFLIGLELGLTFGVALLISTFWAIHPYHAEMMMWLSARKDVLAICLGLMSTYFFIIALKKDRISFYLLCLFFFLASLLSKPGSIFCAIFKIHFKLCKSYPLEISSWKLSNPCLKKNQLQD